MVPNFDQNNPILRYLESDPFATFKWPFATLDNAALENSLVIKYAYFFYVLPKVCKIVIKEKKILFAQK